MTSYSEGVGPSLWSRIFKLLGPKALLTWVLLLIALVSIISGLTEVIKGLEFGFAFTIALLAVSTGWILAMLPIKGWFGGVFGTFIGLELLLLRVGRLGGVVWQIFSAVLTTLFEFVAWVWAWILALIQAIYYWEPIEPVFRTIYWARLPDIYVELWSDIGTLLARASTWLISLIAGSGTFDPVATALVWGAVLWGCAWWAGWAVNRRHQPLVGMVPGGVLLSFILAYTWASSFVLLPMVGFTFLLMALARQRAREIRWQGTGTDFSRDLWSDLVMIATAVSIALVLIAAISPSITLEKVQDFVEWIEDLVRREDESSEPRVADSLGIEQQPQPHSLTPIERAQVTTLPRRHLIGSGPELSRMVVMVVRTGELPEIPDMTVIDEEVPRHYWRSITYDRYYGQGWATSNTELIRYEGGEKSISTDVPFHYILRQEVQMIGAWDGTVYVDGKLISVDEPFEIYWRPPLELFAATTEAVRYRADSLIPFINDAKLREAEGQVPDWLQERYLQLPEDLPQRVRDLALELTATEPTAYDRAKAIETYLRQFPYTLEVETPAYGKDIADYFLFELQEGYCDYYATSMVVLARAAGLPARLVIGYAPGTYEPYSARYIVTEADAHAWPEIYFPEIGWVEFEPTGGYPEIDRSAEETEDYLWPDGYDFEPLSGQDEDAGPRIVVGVWFLIGVGGTLGLLLLYTGIDSLFLLVWGKPESMVTRLYHRLRRYRRRLRARSRDGQTPYEVAVSLANRIDEISKDRDVAEELLPDAAKEIRSLVDLYVRAWYTPQLMVRRERVAAVWIWWVLRWRLWLAWLWRSPRRERSEMPVVPRPLPDPVETQRPTM